MPDAPLRLGLVGPLPPPNGGMAMQTLQLQRLLAGEGVRVELVQTNAPYRPRMIGRVRGVRALFRLLPYLVQLWRLAGRVDVVHLMANSGWSWQLFAAPAIWIARLRGTPVVVNYRGGEAREYLARSLRWVKPTLDRCSSLVVPSGFLREVFAEFGVSARVVPNIIDLEAFRPAERDSRGDTFNLVVTRNLEAIYGLDTAIRSLAIARQRQPQLRLHIAGSGPQLGQLQALARSEGVEEAVFFLGRLERGAVIDLYAAADAMLNPTRVDNMPNSVLEALACGLPVISTRVGGVPFILEHGRNALLVPPDDPQAMADAVEALVRDRDLRQRLREEGRREVEQYSWERVGPQWLDLYRRLEAAA
ncbi:MAG: glycosyltransferase family 4 protein [Halioglobus sp.]|nr:glycosyltransferase family 4 protein [Halioglobus sp.]